MSPLRRGPHERPVSERPDHLVQRQRTRASGSSGGGAGSPFTVPRYSPYGREVITRSGDFSGQCLRLSWPCGRCATGARIPGASWSFPPPLWPPRVPCSSASSGVEPRPVRCPDSVRLALLRRWPHREDRRRGATTADGSDFCRRYSSPSRRGRVARAPVECVSHCALPEMGGGRGVRVRLNLRPPTGFVAGALYRLAVDGCPAGDPCPGILTRTTVSRRPEKGDRHAHSASLATDTHFCRCGVCTPRALDNRRRLLRVLVDRRCPWARRKRGKSQVL